MKKAIVVSIIIITLLLVVAAIMLIFPQREKGEYIFERTPGVFYNHLMTNPDAKYAADGKIGLRYVYIESKYPIPNCTKMRIIGEMVLIDVPETGRGSGYKYHHVYPSEEIKCIE